MNGQRNIQAERHADRASEILREYDQDVLDHVRAAHESDGDWAASMDRLLRKAERHAALATAHAMTAIALRKVGGR